MEFGAMQCRPMRPLCKECPLQTSCVAYQKGLVEKLPVRTKKAKARKRYFNYLVIREEGNLFLRKRGAGDIWQSLYEFPLVETGTPVETSGLFLLEDFRKILNDRHFLVSSVSETVKHVLSHQVILARFWELELKGSPVPEKQYLAVGEKELEAYAFPKLIANYLENNRNL